MKGQHERIDYSRRTARYFTGYDDHHNPTFAVRLLPPEYNTLNPDTGMAKCRKCGREGIDLSLLPECTTGPFGTGEEL